jgi:hypothetical protein
LLGSGALLAPVAPAALSWTAEDPGVTTSPHECVLVETFDSGSPSTVIGTYTGAFISDADVWGGDDGTDYLDLDRANESTEVTLTLNQTESYFGMWWSADSPGNAVTFFNGAVEIGSFDDSIFDSLGAGYLGSPEVAFLGQNAGEKYAFINFSGMEFDKIVFTQTEPGGFESDNHTVRRSCDVPDGGSLLGAFAGVAASLLWVRRKARA